MKYTNLQKKILKESKKQRFRLNFDIDNDLNNHSEIELERYVDIIDGYYVIESQLNKNKIK